MSSGLHVPVLWLPKFEEFLDAIKGPLLEINMAVGDVVVGIGVGRGVSLSDNFILVQDINRGFVCWVSFVFLEQSVREEAEQDLPVMAHVFSRSEDSNFFATAVAYAVASGFSGRIVYDDAHVYLGGVDSLPLVDLKEFCLSNV